MFHTSKGPTGNGGRRGAARTRPVGLPVRQQPVRPPLDAAGELLIRVAGPNDRPVLDDLAARDSRPRLRGDALIAELDGVVVAALSLRDGQLIADPWKPTAVIGEQLRLRASSIAATTAPAGPLKGLRQIAPARGELA